MVFLQIYMTNVIQSIKRFMIIYYHPNFFNSCEQFVTFVKIFLTDELNVIDF